MHFFFKKRRTPGYIIILHLHTKNLNDMIYSFRDIEHDRLKFVILGHFLPFYQKITQKLKIFEKWKNLLEISSLLMSTKNHNHMIYGSVPRYRLRQTKFFFHFGLFLALYPLPLMNLKNRILKKWKKYL